MNNTKFQHNSRFYALVAALLAFSLALTAPAAQASTQPSTGQVVGYYEAYNGTAALAQVPWQALTRLNVAFIGIGNVGAAAWLVSDGHNLPDMTGNALNAVRALVAARDQHNPKVKLMLSVGGATMSNRFSKAVSTADGRRILATSSVGVAKTLGLDGVDYDWEYPGHLGQNNCEQGQGNCACNADFANFTLLLQATRDQQAVQAKDQLLTVAVYVDPTESGVPYDVRGMDPLLDAWNVMAYDIAAPSWNAQTAFPAGIARSTDSLAAFVKLGACPKKMVLGVPFYSYIWRHVPWAGIGATPTAAQGSSASQQLSIDTLFNRYAGQDGCKLTEANDGDYYYCSYGPLAGEWCPIDSVRVIQQKGAFVRDGGYGGLMSWTVSMDTPAQLMANTMAQSLR